jgi:hypothetical protein
MLPQKILKFRVSETPFHALWGKILQNSDGQRTRYIRLAICFQIAPTGRLGFYFLTQHDLI